MLFAVFVEGNMAGVSSGIMTAAHKSAWGRRLGLVLLSLVMLMTLSACSWMKFWDTDEEPPVPKPSPAKHWEQSMAYKRAGDLNNAAISMENAIKADPNMYQAYYQLGRIYYDMGQKDQARRVWRVGLARAKGGPDRRDYPRQRAMAEMQAALAAVQPKPMPKPVTPAPAPQPKTVVVPQPAPMAKPKPAPVEPMQTDGDFAVLYSSNLNKSYAQRDVTKLKGMGLLAEVRSAVVKGRTFHRVLVGCCTTKMDAEATQGKLRSMGVARKTTVMKVK
jgi:cell division septation protein DedD